MNVMSVSGVTFPEKRSIEQFFMVGLYAESCKDEKEAEKRAAEMAKINPTGKARIHKVLITLVKEVPA